MDLISPYVELFQRVFSKDSKSSLSQAQKNRKLYERFFELGKAHWHESLDIVFPKDLIFIDRTFAGHFGNLSKLGANALWQDIFDEFAQQHYDSPL